MKNLVIVESPAKSKTIEKFLGRDYRVIASYGHVMDLPKSKMGIDIEHDFKPQYIIPTKSRKTVNTIKSEAAKAEKVLLATDPDREGEAIAWHIKEAIGKPAKRIVFHEITKEAVEKAIKEPRDLNANLFDSQQARRVLDRLVGYTLSPFLWQKVKKGLSAGRVQSVAVKMIVDREKEIEKFKPKEFWEISAELKNDHNFIADLIKYNDKALVIPNKDKAAQVERDLKKAEYLVKEIVKRQTNRKPAAPFTTSTLQQEAARRLGYSAKRTMMIAQQLYEGIALGEKEEVGLITYMRTDSKYVSESFKNQAREFIKRNYGQDYLNTTDRIYKKSKMAQEAHEAIRPTYVFNTPSEIKGFLTKDQLRLYTLIYNRALASQMSDAVYDQIRVDISANDYLFRSTGRSIAFDGFIKVYQESSDEEEDRLEEFSNLSSLKEGERVSLVKLNKDQKFTQPPARLTEASLVKALEESGVGRPSTYAPTISTIIDRGYVRVEERKLIPQPIGVIVTDLLSGNFPFVVDSQFTAEMENNLDEVALGEKKWREIISDFWFPFEKEVEAKKEKVERVKIPEKKTDEKCEKCGHPMVIKYGRFGEFLACSNFPECKNTKPIVKSLDMKCPKCEEGDVIERKTRKGRIFWGCSRYPECDFATWNDPRKTAQKETQNKK